MNWFQIVLMIIGLLRDLKRSGDRQAFAATATGQAVGGDGKLIDWLWENREEILEFVLKIIGLFGKGEEVGTMKALLDD